MPVWSAMARPDPNPFETFVSKLRDQLSDLSTLQTLNVTSHDSEALALFHQLHNALSLGQVSTQMNEIRDFLAGEEECLQKLKQERHALTALNSRMQFALSHLPKRLPVKECTDSPLEPSTATPNTAPAAKPSADKSAKPKVKPKVVDALALITVKEFESIPSYLRGRINYDALNEKISQFNSALEHKYKIVATNGKKLNRMQQDLYWRYREEETAETKGRPFITDDDLKEFAQWGSDPNSRRYLTIFRHCGRIQEVRTGKLVRYVMQL